VAECATFTNLLPSSVVVESGTGNGLLVSSSSHKREVAGSIPAGCTRTFLYPLPLSPHRLTSYFDVWRHLASAKIRMAQNNIVATRRQLDPPTWRTTVLPLQSTGEERTEATK
jgi:hypothetical protein